jgi:uncharacterized membrane protein
MQAALSRIVDWLICSLAAMAIGLALRLWSGSSSRSDRTAR